MDEFIIIHTTCGEVSDAKLIAEALVGSGLVKCAQICEINSIYSWESEIMDEPEFRLDLKAKAEDFKHIEDWIKGMHNGDKLSIPYETPEIIAVAITASSIEYAQYLRD